MQRASVDSRVSILSRFGSDDFGADPPYPALLPTAYVHLDATKPRVTKVPNSEAIVWPDGSRFPPDIPQVAALNIATGTNCSSNIPNQNGTSKCAASSLPA